MEEEEKEDDDDDDDDDDDENNLKQDQSMQKVSNVLHCCPVKIGSFPALNLLCVFRRKRRRKKKKKKII